MNTKQLKEFNISPQTKFIICQTVTGEQLVAVLRNETDQAIVVEYPMEISSVKFQTEEGEFASHTTAQPFCKFANDRVFALAKQNLLYLKTLHKYAIPFYIGLLEEYESYIEVAEPNDADFQEIKERFDNIARDLQEQEEEEDTVINHKGSKTLH